MNSSCFSCLYWFIYSFICCLLLAQPKYALNLHIICTKSDNWALNFMIFNFGALPPTFLLIYDAKFALNKMQILPKQHQKGAYHTVKSWYK